MRKKTLSIRENYELCNFITQKYVEAKVNDVEFTEIVKKELGLDVEDHHISARRREMGIPSFIRKVERIDPEQFAKLEERVKILEALFVKCGKP